METYVLVDSIQATGTSNSYVYRLPRILKGVKQAELLSAAYQKQTSCTHVFLDINEFKNPMNINGYFGVINNLSDSGSNLVSFTKNSFYELKTCFENPFNIDRVTVAWKDPTGNLINISNNSVFLKVTHCC